MTKRRVKPAAPAASAEPVLQRPPGCADTKVRKDMFDDAVRTCSWSFATELPQLRTAVSAGYSTLVSAGVDPILAGGVLMNLALCADEATTAAEEEAHKNYDDDRNGLGIQMSMSTQLMAVRGPSATDVLTDAHSLALLAARVAEASGAAGAVDARALGRAAAILAELSAGLVTAATMLLSEEGGSHG